MATTSTDQSFLTTGEVAGLLRISEQTVRRHAGQLGAVRAGNQLRFPTPIQAPTLDVDDGAHDRASKRKTR